MKTHRIAVIPGDGIGPEVLAEGVKVLKEVAKRDGRFAFQFEYFPWGCEYYLRTGEMMEPGGIEKLKEFEAIFLGAVGYPGVPEGSPGAEVSLIEFMQPILKFVRPVLTGLVAILTVIGCYKRVIALVNV